MTEHFINDFKTTLNGAITNTATSLSVNDSPPSGLTANFRIRIENEFLLVTAIGGTGNKDWTVTREAEEPTRFPKAAHSSGAEVKQVLSVGGLAQTIADSASSVDDSGTLVQSYNWASKSSGGTAVLGAAPTNGNLLIFVAATNQFSVTSLTQTGVTWTKVLQSLYSSGNVVNLEVWKGVVGSGASATATISFGGNNTQYVTLFEYSGLSTVDVLNRSAAAGGPGTSNLNLSWKTPGGRAFAGFLGRAANDPVPFPSYWTARGGSPAAVLFGRAWWGDYDAESDSASSAEFLDHLHSPDSAQTDFWAQLVLHLKP